MARNERIIKASPRDVFDVLSDPRGYAYWVVGSMEIRDADSSWPEKGSRLHHTVGVGRLRIKDHTTVEAVEDGRYLQLKAKTGPLGSARVKVSLEEAEGGTRVTMIEDPADKPTAFVFMPITHLLMRARNVRSLDRLAELAERRTPMPGDGPGASNRTPDGDGALENPRARERR
jgi:uncharacterized protein YndB with AHSA1/START domain